MGISKTAKEKKMHQAGERLKTLRDQKKALNAEVKRLEPDIDAANNDLACIMRANKTEHFAYMGNVYTLVDDICVKSKGDDLKADFHEALRKNGYGFLITETVNSAKLTSFMKDLLKKNKGQMPEWMGLYITVDPKDTVEIKKETVKMK